MSEPSRPDVPLFPWSVVVESLARPYRVTAPMAVLVGLIPLYIFIPAFFPPDVRHIPQLALDRAVPLIPA
jgi:hypothetical protein